MRFLSAVFAFLAFPCVATYVLAQEGFTQVPLPLPQGVLYQTVASADYDGDGDQDLLVIRNDNSWEDPRVYTELYRNDGIGTDGGLRLTLAPFPVEPAPVTSPPGSTVSWADYDSDGDLDVLIGTNAGTRLYRNDLGTFVDAGIELPPYVERTSYYFAEPKSSAWADYDNDGDLDLVLPEYVNGYPGVIRLVLYENEGAAFVPTNTEFPEIDGDVDLAWGDVDGDGDLDLLYLSAGAGCDNGGECLILYDNDGGVLLPRPVDFPEIEGGAADLGDFDLDGDLDILLVATLNNEPFYHYDRAIVYRNDGSTFTADTLSFPFTFDEVFDDLTAGEWGDYDSDGDVDVLIGGNVGDGEGPGEDFGGVVFVFANDGGTFTFAADLPASYLYGSDNWADFDSDGDLDLLVTGDRLEDMGDNQWGWVSFARLYRNDSPRENASPSPPSSLSWAPHVNVRPKVATGFRLIGYHLVCDPAVHGPSI